MFKLIKNLTNDNFLFPLSSFLFPLKAFTLAELMIVLGVLGVLAAILIPALTKISPDNNKVMFKKAYYTLERALSLMINDDVNYPSEQTIELSDGYIYQKGFNNTAATTNTDNKFCTFLADALNTIGTVTCPATTEAGYNHKGTFTTSDGVIWTLYFPVADSANTGETGVTASTDAVQFPINVVYYTTKVLIDVNGTKGPNCTVDSEGSLEDEEENSIYGLTICTGSNPNPDKFIIGVRYDGKLQVGCSTVDAAGCTTTTDQTAIDILSTPTDNTKD